MINEKLETYRQFGSGFKNNWERDNCKTDVDVKYKVIMTFFDLLLTHKVKYSKAGQSYNILREHKTLFDNCGLDEEVLALSGLWVTFV